MHDKATQEQSIEQIKVYLKLLVNMYSKHNGGIPAKVRPIPQLLLDHGRAFIYDKDSFTHQGEPKMCFMNAGMLALNDSDLTYCEGYFDTFGVISPHAWCIDRHGFVIDPTLRWHENIGGFFGIPFRTSYLRRTIQRTHYWGLLDIHNKRIFEASFETKRFIQK